jgi:hypothetical protein
VISGDEYSVGIIYDNTCMSLHTLRARDNIRTQPDDCIINKPFSSIDNTTLTVITYKCIVLGRDGWTICPFWKPAVNEHLYNTWYKLSMLKTGEQIKKYFLEKDWSLLTQIIEFSLNEIHRPDMLFEAYELFKNKFYTSCAMLLTAILEKCIYECTIETWRRQVIGPINYRIVSYLPNADKEEKELSSESIATFLLITSLDAFINTYFKNDAEFENSTEPLHLERAWLMHGQITRMVTDVDCIKLFNAICSFNYLLYTLLHNQYRD